MTRIDNIKSVGGLKSAFLLTTNIWYPESIPALRQNYPWIFCVCLSYLFCFRQHASFSLSSFWNLSWKYKTCLWQVCLHIVAQANFRNSLKFPQPRSTYIAEEVDEGVVAAIGHGQPVQTEPDDVNVRVAGNMEIAIYI